MCRNFSIWNEQFPWIYLSLQGLMSLTMYELYPLQLRVVAFLSNFVSDKTAGFTDWLYWSLSWWSETTSEATLSEELHSGGVRLFFEWYCLQSCLFFFPYSNWLFRSEGVAPWNYYISSLAWLVSQKSEKIRFITKAAIISFQSKERTEKERLWT